MVSSTFRDLEKHREVVTEALRAHELFAIDMKDHLADPDDDEISVSLKMVQKAAAYIGIISHRYGTIYESPERNPRNHSISRLEFEKAQDLGLPTLIFVMSEDHPMKPGEIEIDPEKREKLKAYRDLAKKNRIYESFDNLEDFTKKAINAVAKLRRYLDDRDRRSGPSASAVRAQPDPIPTPPAFYAEPPYLGSHEFVGRRDQLETLNEWALPADSHPVLLFEAIGGSGKSMLTWEWVRNHAPSVRKGTKEDWAGRFWYSFYERGAIMADFCQRALAYMTGRPLDELRKKKTAELAPQLLHQLEARPWLLILDGLERVLVAYHRIDAAQLRDEEAGKTDEIAERDVCAAIRPEDDELLRTLAAAAPSKLLLTSRLVPRVLLNKASQPVPGVQRVPLPGLRPADAEALFRACGVTGDSTAIQAYLTANCACHPLTVGVLAGLVKDYLPDRGNFDRWSADSQGGGVRLNLADLNLVQRRNHILLAAIAALRTESRTVLSLIALLSEAVDYETLEALNPHQPPKIEEVPIPEKPHIWDLEDDDSAELKESLYRQALRCRAEYEKHVETRLRSQEFLAASVQLAEAIKDLEGRSLLQYDAQAKHYDLHPVVRAVAAGGLAQAEKEIYGQRVVDHFSSQPHNPYENAETLEDVSAALQVVRTFVQMGRFQDACNAYSSSLSHALFFNLEAHVEVVALLRPFFPAGWGTLPTQVCKEDAAALAHRAAISLTGLAQRDEQLAAFSCSLASYLDQKVWRMVDVQLRNLSATMVRRNRLAKSDACLRLAFEISSLNGRPEDLFLSQLFQFIQLTRLGQWIEAESSWQKLDPMGRDWDRGLYRPGCAEFFYAQALFWQGKLAEHHLVDAEKLAHDGRSRGFIRLLHGLRGEWHLEQQQWEWAAESFHEAVQMARAVNQSDSVSEARLALAKLRLGSLSDPRQQSEQLARLKDPPDRALAELWIAIGDREEAKKHALAAYQWAWADGEPFVWHYSLNKSRALLEQLGAEIPNLPRYDPTKDEKLPWEDAVVAAIEELRAEKTAEAVAKETEGELRTPTEDTVG